jgi:hypothetical protein
MGSKNFFLTFCLLLVFSSHIVHAQSPSPIIDPTPTPIQYTLPYPGMLPGHPFYFLKMARDGIWGFLLSQPLKKAEFALLQADKNMQAALFLSQKKQSSEKIFETITAAKDNYEKAITYTAAAKKQGIGIKDFVATLVVANKKHQEVLLIMEKASGKDDKKKLAQEREKVKQLGKKAADLTHK